MAGDCVLGAAEGEEAGSFGRAIGEACADDLGVDLLHLFDCATVGEEGGWGRRV